MSTRSPGRPRSEYARRSVLAAATRLLAEHGYGAVTMEGIARRAGVSKQTIYRWWPSAAAVLLEALNDAAQELAPVPDTGSLEMDLRSLLRRTVAGTGAGNTGILAALMAQAQLDEDFATAFRGGFLAGRREALGQVLKRARSRGQLTDAVDPGFLAELALGALWYRILGRHAPLNQRFADQLTDSLLALARSPYPHSRTARTRSGPTARSARSTRRPRAADST